MGVKEMLESKAGAIIISLVLGLGLAALFFKACDGKDCIVVQGPRPGEVEKYVYKIKDGCYKYTPEVTECTDNAIHIRESPP